MLVVSVSTRVDISSTPIAPAPRDIKEGGRIGGVGRHTDSYATDVGMPDFGVELHDGRLEGVHVGDSNIDLEVTASVRGVGRAGEGALKVGEVGIVDGLGEDAGVVFIALDVGELLGNTALSCRRHGWSG